MKWVRATVVFAAVVLPVLLCGADARWSDNSPVGPPSGLTAAARWDGLPPRRWAGPAIWCNRLQDWHIAGGALVCQTDRRLPCRTAHLLTYELGDGQEPFRVAVTLRSTGPSAPGDFAGLLLGAGEGRLDYRGAAMIHQLPGKGGGILA